MTTLEDEIEMEEETPAMWYNANGHERGPIGELRPALPPSDSLRLPTEEIGRFPPWWLVIVALVLAGAVAALAALVWTSPVQPGGPAAPASVPSTYGPPGAESGVVR